MDLNPLVDLYGHFCNFNRQKLLKGLDLLIIFNLFSIKHFAVNHYIYVQDIQLLIFIDFIQVFSIIILIVVLYILLYILK